MALWLLLQTAETVVHAIRHHWLLVGLHATLLVLLGLGLLVIPWRPSMLVRAEELNRELIEGESTAPRSQAHTEGA